MTTHFIKLLTLASVIGAAGVASPRAAPPQTHARQDTVSRRDTIAIPFGVGEKLTFDVAVGGARVGTGYMNIEGTEDVRGHRTLHSVFDIEGGVLFFKVHDRLESWFDTTTMSSHRFVQQIKEGSYKKSRYNDIYPERAIFQQKGYPEMASVANPLDDGSFLYFIRTIPLEVGKTYSFERYFRPDKNPVIVKVLRKEQVTVKAGTFNTIVIQPIIKSGGIFADGGQAYIWLTDDDRRLMVQFKAKAPIIQTLDLYLKSYTPPTDASASNQ